jgi:hypothetical protein
MEIKYGGRLPEWRYRAMSGYASADGTDSQDEFQAEGEARLAAAGLPWCFGEMSYPHWRRVPISDGDPRSASYYAGDTLHARETALTRVILCSRCPVFDRCHKLAVAKKSANPNLSAAKRKADMLAALGRM